MAPQAECREAAVKCVTENKERIKMMRKKKEQLGTDNPLLDNKQLRDKYVGRYEILEQGRKLLLIPNTGYAVIPQVADYYKVGVEAIASLIKNNRAELLEDGLINATGTETKEILGKFSKDFANERGYFTCDEIKFNHRNNLLFTRRAILRVGMLLRDSEVAREIRTQLLNIEEKTDPEVKIKDIEEEQKLALELGMSIASGNVEAITIASGKMMAFKNRHIAKLENDNKALAGEILSWSDRKKLNAGVRQLAAVTGIPFGNLWNELYKNLQYKYGICVKQRGGTPYIQWIEEEEWECVIKIFCAMCEAYEQSPTEMFQQTTPKIALASK